MVKKGRRFSAMLYHKRTFDFVRTIARLILLLQRCGMRREMPDMADGREDKEVNCSFVANIEDYNRESIDQIKTENQNNDDREAMQY